VAAEGVETDHPDRDLAPDAFANPPEARMAPPPRPLRPTLISRLRDQVALRLALMRGPDTDEAVGPAGGAQPPESVGPVVAAMRARMDPPASDRRSGWGGGATTSWDPDRAGASAWPEVPFRPTTAEEIPRAPAPSRVLELDGGPRTRGRHARRLGDQRGLPGAAGGSGFAGWGGIAALPGRLRRLGDRPRLAWIAAAVLAVVVIMVSFLVSHAGAPAPAGLATAGTTAQAAGASRAPVVRPSTSTAPTVGPTVTATPASTPVPTPALAAQTYGAGGAGWQLQDVRCCSVEAGTGYTRIVFDLGGASGANPTASVSFPTSTTVVVSFPGVTAPAMVTASGSGGLVTGVTRESGSELTFRLTLSRAAAVQDYGYLPNADAESSAPLHLYFDLD
jgi:hypothetical protein